MAWTDLSGAFGYGTKLTSAQMQALRDNIAALAAGDSGAPEIVGGALQYLAGSTRITDTGAPGKKYEVLDASGNWNQCCPLFEPAGS